jgi:hypothetical protein
MLVGVLDRLADGSEEVESLGKGCPTVATPRGE